VQEQVFAAEGITIQPVCSAEEIEVITGLIENGFGISVLPYMDIVHLHNLVAIPVQTSIWKSKFYIARRKYESRSAAIALSAKTVSLVPLQRLELWTP